MNKLQEIKQSVQGIDEFGKYTEIFTEDLNWLFEQVELLEKIISQTGLIISKKVSNEEIEKFKKEWSGLI
jgi:hypothetical protein